METNEIAAAQNQKKENRFMNTNFRAVAKGSGRWTRGCLSIEDTPVGRVAKVNGYMVDPDTIEQGTGVADASGSEVYEGDIIRWTRASGKGNRTAEIRWCPERGKLAPCRVYGENGERVWWFATLRMIPSSRVIGNVRDGVKPREEKKESETVA